MFYVVDVFRTDYKLNNGNEQN